MAQANRPEGLSGGSRGATGITKGLTSKQIKAIAKISNAKTTVKNSKIPSESDISYALRHGKITREEAAALDPKKFKILLDNSKTKTIFTVNLKTGKTTKGKK